MAETIKDKIRRLKKERDAVILAHYYVPEDVQDIADYVGDSYYLCRIASEESANVIVLCGVYFMGESAKIINPDKTVLMPELKAECPMAYMSKPEDVERIRAMYDDTAVVCYVNSTAEIKALSDVCVTSSNALAVIRALPQQHIYFIPDKNLGRYVAKQVPEKQFICGNGFCHVHTGISAEDVIKVKREHREAAVVSHPECREEVISISDFTGSTSGIISYIEKSDRSEFIICTEIGILYKLKKNTRGKSFYIPSKCQVCCGMKMNTLEKLLDALENSGHEIKIHDKDIMAKGLASLNRMMAMAGGDRK